MSLPSSGIISLNAINAELGKSATGQLSLNDSDVRALLGKASGQISLSDAYGKSKGSSLYIIAGFGDDVSYTTLMGWNSVVDFIGLPIMGSPSNNPLPATPYAGFLYGLAENLNYQSLISWGTFANANYWITVNGQRINMVYNGYDSTFNVHYHSSSTAVSQLFKYGGAQTPISFG